MAVHGLGEDTTEFRILGPVEVWAGREPLALGAAKQRTVLAALLFDVNKRLSTETLITRVWDDAPPPQARKVLHAHLSRIRSVLARSARAGDDRPELQRGSDGYLLRVDSDHVDLCRARRLVDQARSPECPEPERAALLAEAVGLWRGEPLAGLNGDWCARAREHLQEQRLDVVSQWAESALRLGRHQDVVDALGPLLTEHPLAEPLVAALMRALHAAGHGRAALDWYARTRERLAEQLGADPSPALQSLNAAILRDDVPATPAIVPDARTGTEPAPSDLDGSQGGRTPVVAYRHLLPDIAEFTGRREELAAITRAAAEAGSGERRTAVTISAVEGMGGVGKTRLALHAAHRLVERGLFEDGQLYVDLRGFAPDEAPISPAAALESLLRLLGVRVEAIPEQLPARSAVFRDRLADRRMLIILDNAADEEQVRPLLPASAGCVVFVTSRRSLALDGASSIRVGVFSGEEAVDLLAAVAGADRVAAEPGAARELVAACGHLPLAVALAARRLRARPAWPIAHLVNRLAERRGPLDELAFGQRDVESVFAMSYEALAPEQRRVFRLIGVHPGGDCTAASVAVLAQVGPVDAERILESLLDQHLLQQSVVGRYELHDLLRAYARRLCDTEDALEERHAAMSYLLDWYVHATDTATRMIRRFRVPILAELDAPKTPGPDIVDSDTAFSWLDAEFANLRAAVAVAAEGPWFAHAMRLALLLQPYFIRRGYFAAWVAAARLAESAARELDDTIGRAYATTELGHALASSGQTTAAGRQLRRALELHRTVDDPHGKATTLNHLGTVCRRIGSHAEAVDHYRAALELFRMQGDPVREASTQINLGVQLHILGRHAEGLAQAHQALALQQRIGGPGEASIRTNIGRMYGRLGRHVEAVEQARTAIALHREAASGPGEAMSLANLTASYSRLGRHGEAVEAGLQGVSLARRLSDPESEATTLNALGEAYRLVGDDAGAVCRHREALAVATAAGLTDEAERARAGIAAATSAV